MSRLVAGPTQMGRKSLGETPLTGSWTRFCTGLYLRRRLAAPPRQRHVHATMSNPSNSGGA